MIATWAPAPSQLELEPGWVHVFHFSLAEPLEPLAGCLSADERARAKRFMFAAHRQNFIAAHVQLRQILAAYTHQPPASLVFETNPYGKPSLTGYAQTCFNLSHSRERALLAVCPGRAIGADIEGLRDGVNHASLARRFFSKPEADALLALPAGDQPAVFLAIWTRKEAYIKARGLGLQIPLDSFEVSVLPDQPVTLTDHLAHDGGASWSLHSLDAPQGYAAALAVEGQPDGIRVYEWKALE